MKKLGYIFLCMVALWGCQDNADYPFKGKDAVYFSVADRRLLLDGNSG